MQDKQPGRHIGSILDLPIVSEKFTSQIPRMWRGPLARRASLEPPAHASMCDDAVRNVEK
jgi:hypothetical protein